MACWDGGGVGGKNAIPMAYFRIVGAQGMANYSHWFNQGVREVNNISTSFRVLR